MLPISYLIAVFFANNSIFIKSRHGIAVFVDISHFMETIAKINSRVLFKIK